MAEDKNKELKMDDLENVAGGFKIILDNGNTLDFGDPTPSLTFGPFCKNRKVWTANKSVGDLCPTCGEVLVDSKEGFNCI